MVHDGLSACFVVGHVDGALQICADNLCLSLRSLDALEDFVDSSAPVFGVLRGMCSNIVAQPLLAHEL